MRHYKPTKREVEGIWELIPILDALCGAGWEGTTLECRNDDCGGPRKCETCCDRDKAERALSWLTGVANRAGGRA
jgi:hypothetical protein